LSEKQISIELETEEVYRVLKGLNMQLREAIKELRQIAMAKCLVNEAEQTLATMGDFIEFNSKYQKGDVLLVKEEFMPDHVYSKGLLFKTQVIENSLASCEKIEFQPASDMPKEKARLSLEVVDVRVEKLQAITKEDCIKMGVEAREIPHTPPTYIYRDYNIDLNDKRISPYSLGNPSESFATLWDLDSEEGFGWKDNPYVFVYEFKPVKV
jgi:hypothetical protein